LLLHLCSCAAIAQAGAGHPVPAIPVVNQWQSFSDPNEGAFQLEVPKGWKIVGGTRRWNALQYRNWVSASSPDGNTILGISDPNELSYVAPSQMLMASGFRIGSIYDGGGGTRYIVAPYQSGVQFAVSWGQRKLASLCTSVKVTSQRERPDISQQINAYSRSFGVTHDVGEATFSCSKSGMAMSAYAFTSTTMIGGGGQGGIWYADTIEAFLLLRPLPAWPPVCFPTWCGVFA
jgi:hypothetical protein